MAHAPANALLDASAPTARPASSRRKQIAATMMGNVLEYYDFLIYAYLASTIAKRFFVGDEVTALLASFAAFGAGFLARPLGGAVFGMIADRHGRRVALQLTIFGMAAGTVGIGLLPTYETAGILAPVMLVVLRLVQGLAAGGEWGTATTFIVESAPPGKRGFFGGMGQASVAAALLLASFVAMGLSYLFSPTEIESWAWRLPFLIGFILVVVGVFMRRNLEETEAFKKSKAAGETQKLPMKSALLQMLMAFGFTVAWTVSYYLMLSYMPTFLTKYAGMTSQEALTSNTLGLVVMIVAMPLFGMLSDRIGRKPLLIGSCIGLAVLTYPVFSYVLESKSFLVCIVAQCGINILIAAYSGAAPAALCELFPTASRTVLLSIGYSIATAIFGGFAPFIATWLIAATGSPISPIYYLIGACATSLIFITRMRETAHREIS